MSALYQRLMAVDPSLTCSGWALLDIERASLLAVGKIRSLPAEIPMAERLLDIQQKIAKVFAELQLGSADVLICEAPTTMRDPRAAFQVEQVRGIFETLARVQCSYVPGRLNPRSVQYEVMGLKGKQIERSMVKHTALQTAEAIYGEELQALGLDVQGGTLKRHQDIVDAVLIGSLGLTRIEASKNSGIPLSTLLAEGNSGRSRRKLPRMTG